MEVGGTIGLGETSAVTAALVRRLYGWRRYGFCIYLGVMVAITAIWLNLPDATGLNWGIALLGLLATVVLVVVGYVRWAKGLIPAAWKRMGALAEVAVRYRADEAGLVIEGGVTIVVPWGAVMMVAPEKTAWLIIAGGTGFFLPRRFFADVAEERAFVAFGLERLSPEARTRSAEAATFLAKVKSR